MNFNTAENSSSNKKEAYSIHSFFIENQRNQGKYSSLPKSLQTNRHASLKMTQQFSANNIYHLVVSQIQLISIIADQAIIIISTFRISYYAKETKNRIPHQQFSIQEHNQLTNFKTRNKCGVPLNQQPLHKASSSTCTTEIYNIKVVSQHYNFKILKKYIQQKLLDGLVVMSKTTPFSSSEGVMLIIQI